METTPDKQTNRGPVLARRIGVYVLGLLILAMGVSVSVRSDLGVSPVSAVPLVFGKVLGLDLGNATILVFSLYVLVEICILRREFPLIQLLQVVCAVLFGKFVNVTSGLIAFWTPGSYIERLAMILLATVLVAVGIKLYLLADLVPQSSDGLVKTISEKGGWKLPNVKNVFDLSSVTLAALVSLVFLKKITGLREGTVIVALGVGRVMALLNWLDKDRLHRLVYGEPAAKS